MSDMDKRYGPLKLWQWIVIVVALAGVYWWYTKQKEGATETYVPPTESFATGSEVGQGVGGSGGEGVNPSEIPSPIEIPSAPEIVYVPESIESSGSPISGVEETVSLIEKMKQLGLISPQKGKNKRALNRNKNQKNPKHREGAHGHHNPHAKQGSHHHRKTHSGGTHEHHKKLHHKETKPIPKKVTVNGGTAAPTSSHGHGASHHKREHKRRRR